MRRIVPVLLAVLAAAVVGGRRRRRTDAPPTMPPGAGVREPRRPLPSAPSGTAYADG